MSALCVSFIRAPGSSLSAGNASQAPLCMREFRDDNEVHPLPSNATPPLFAVLLGPLASRRVASCCHHLNIIDGLLSQVGGDHVLLGTMNHTGRVYLAYSLDSRVAFNETLKIQPKSVRCNAAGCHRLDKIAVSPWRSSLPIPTLKPIANSYQPPTAQKLAMEEEERTDAFICRGELLHYYLTSVQKRSH